ncbi:cutinase family protein [Candidatus Mycobacterium methanotrophicum]|uniref:Cutinase family protein n=1 Tax=Candidatus Mycobacterium methanotrophicum TaxID=2943498 RepID=A0ABY4QJH9_9MYCO|nr:cutinase family protein [Candidatus Mycobacterium methanotrophicum]UQX11172.1 cutinase family protein [Candidatus Mycobacterium methanotrophicum]
MSRRSFARIVSSALVTVWAVPTATEVMPVAFAEPCPDVEVVFARGTGEPSGVGGAGQAFIDSLTAQVSGKSVGVYPVNYPATPNYVDSARAGAADADAHIQNMAGSCPSTKLVLGGYSQGAAVMDLTSNELPARVGDHVAAVALFGNPSSSYSKQLSDNQFPPVSSAYRPKTIDLCVPDDMICGEGGNILAHLSYVPDVTNQAAASVAGRL